MQAHELGHYQQDIKRNLTRCKNNDHPFIFFDNEPTLDIVIVKKYYNDLEIDVNYSNEGHYSFHSFISPLTIANSISRGKFLYSILIKVYRRRLR